MKILLVDDSVKVRRLTKSLFSGMQVEFAECADGDQALATYREQQPDWVLMDIQMPQVDGLTATRQIIDVFPQARVLIVSQFNGPDLRAEARQAGACGYILKENLLQARELIEAESRRESVGPE